jgi:hypothetical protein
MKPIVVINTFKGVFFDQRRKPIVICDIDHTFIRPIRDYKDCYNQIKQDFHNHKEIDIDRDVNDILEMSIKLGMVKQTDEKGFLLMLERIQTLEGKIVFLTARSSESHTKTLQDLTKAGLLNPDKYEIHYTGNRVTKGEYIRNHNLLNGYNHPIFIDDYPHFLESALKLYPTMDCYLFKYDR